MTNSINSATLTDEKKRWLLKINTPLEQHEKLVLISLVQKFINLLYIGQDKFCSDLFILKKNVLGFNDKELALCAKLFTDKSPLINLLAQYNQNWLSKDRMLNYFFKNLKNIVPEPMGKKTKKQRPYKDINIFF